MFGHVTRGRNDEPLEQIRHMEAPGSRPPGRQKKTRKKVVEEDMKETGAVNGDALDRTGWRVIIKLVTS